LSLVSIAELSSARAQGPGAKAMSVIAKKGVSNFITNFFAS
jgi:hypothetical protein